MTNNRLAGILETAGVEVLEVGDDWIHLDDREILVSGNLNQDPDLVKMVDIFTGRVYVGSVQSLLDRLAQRALTAVPFRRLS